MSKKHVEVLVIVQEYPRGLTLASKIRLKNMSDEKIAESIADCCLELVRRKR